MVDFSRSGTLKKVMAQVSSHAPQPMQSSGRAANIFILTSLEQLEFADHY
jgi:hypothetical protein